MTSGSPPTATTPTRGPQRLPVATPQAGYDLLCPGVTGAANGDPCSGSLKTMCLKAGTYKLATRIEFKKTRMGTASRMITMMADPAATTKPILDFSSQPRLACGVEPSDKNQYGIDIGADYYKVQGLEITGANDSGILIQGAHDTVQNCDVHDSADTGILISSSSGYTGQRHVRDDPRLRLAPQQRHPVRRLQRRRLRRQEGERHRQRLRRLPLVGQLRRRLRLLRLDRRRHGQELLGLRPGDRPPPALAATATASRWAATSVSAAHVMSSCFAFDNNETAGGSHVSDWGFTNNSNPATIKCTGCGAWNNKGGTFQSISHSGDVTASTTTAKASAAKRNADGSLPDITKL